MPQHITVLFNPTEFEALPSQDLSQSVCVVFDILRATSSMVTGLYHGATSIIPAADIPEALSLHDKNPQALLAGERSGVRITAEQTGGVDFDLANSPREYTRTRVAGKKIITTTTNGTRALRACAQSPCVLVSSFLNLTATVQRIQQLNLTSLLLVCGGTYEETAYEDVLAAGAVTHLLTNSNNTWKLSDAALMARQLYQHAETPLVKALGTSRNGSRLLELPDLRDDVAWCANIDTMPIVVQLNPAGEAQVV